MNPTLNNALCDFDRADREARYVDALAPIAESVSPYHAKRDPHTGEWLVVSRGGREVLRLVSGTQDACEVAERSAALLCRKARGRE